MRETNDLPKLPDSWMWVKLSELIKIRNGFAFKSTDYKERGALLLRQSNIGDGIVETGKAVYLPNEYLNTHSEFLIQNGDVLIGMSGSIGKLCVYNLDTPALQNQRTGLLQFFEPETKQFIRYFFPTLEGQFESLAKGVAVQNISAENIEACFIPVAPLPEQHRIVAKLEELFTELDSGIESLKKARAQLKRYRQAVLKAAVTGELTREWREAHRGEVEPAADLLARILRERRARWEADQLAKMKAAGRPPKNDDWRKRYPEPSQVESTDDIDIPEGWGRTNVDNLSVVVRGASPRPAGSPKYFGGNIPWITVGSLTADNRPYLLSVSEFVTEAGRDASRYIEPDTLLLTNSGATLGVPKIIMIGGCINDGSVALLYLDYPLKLYLYYYLAEMTKKLRQVNQGAAQPNLNTSIVKAIPISLPPLAEQQQIVSEVERLLSIADATEQTIGQSLKQAERLRQSILQQAFAGKLVPQDPADEPAETLLARIRAERARNGSASQRPQRATHKQKKTLN